MITPAELTTPNFPNWCPGCGNFGIWAAFKNAIVASGWDNTNTVFVAGIGCHGHMINFVKLTSFEGLHGRPIPVANGIKMSNHRLNVFVFTGDGDCLGEGGNHFINAARRNHNVTVLIHNNNIYGLTTGQTSPTTRKGFKSKSTPEGNPDEPFKILNLAIAAGATFAARVYSNDIAGLTNMIIKANEHQGFSVVEMLQPCVTFNKECSPTFFTDNTYKLPADYDPTNIAKALEKTLEFGPKQIPVGLFYKVDKPTAESNYPQIENIPLVDNLVEKRDITKLLQTLY
ncbi:MAG TPA: thiamine pyrophosphate-dependent enzyme [Patescibacteria group bacterium]